MRLVWDFDYLHFAQYISISPHGIDCKQTWCKKIHCMDRVSWLEPLLCPKWFSPHCSPIISLQFGTCIVPVAVCIHVKHIKFHMINLLVIIVLASWNHAFWDIFYSFFVMQMKTCDLQVLIDTDKWVKTR